MLKRNGLSNHEKHGRTLNMHYYVKVVNLKGYVLHSSQLYDILEKEKTMKNIKRITGCQDFWGSENTLYDTIMMDTCHYTIVQTENKQLQEEP